MGEFHGFAYVQALALAVVNFTVSYWNRWCSLVAESIKAYTLNDWGPNLMENTLGSSLVLTTEFIARVEHFILRTSCPNAQAVRFITQRKRLQK